MDKNHMLTTGVIVVVILLFIISVSIYLLHLYKNLKKDRCLQGDKLQPYISQFNKKCDLYQDKKTIESLTNKIKRIIYSQKYINKQNLEIKEIHQKNIILQTQNKIFQEDLKKYISSLHEKEKELEAYKLVAIENMILYEREQYLCIQLSKRIDILNNLKLSPKYISESQWSLVFDAVNIVYFDLTNRLQKQFPTLTENDLQICCLIKAQFSNSFISIFLGISPSSIIKRKQRLKGRINQHLDVPLEKETSIDTYLRKY